jgi:cellulose synthase operon protein C
MERLLRYVVDRLRKHSRILEPDQQINPYRHWGARISDFEKEIAALTDLTDRTELAARVEKLLRDAPKGAKGADQKARVVRAGLEAAPRVGEDFARRMLDQAIPAYDALPEAKELAPLLDQATFLEKALFLAGHFGRIEAVHLLVTRFQNMLRSQKGPQALQVLDKLAAQCFRGLRKLGMRDEIDQILKQMADLILEGQDVKAIDFKKREQGTAALRALLQVAAGWYFFGRDSQAEPILQAARATLMANDLQPRDQTQLACVYAAAVGQAPVEVAQKRLEEIFRQLKMIKDTYTTSSHFSVSQLDVVEAVVLAVVSDDFTMGTQARRWLDDDEFLVRRRIHRDMEAAMIHTGEKGHR